VSVVKAVFCFVLLATCAAFPFVCIAQGTNAGAISGVVLGPDGEPLSGATVHGGHLDVVAESFNLLNHRNVSLLNTAFGSGNTPASGFSAPIATSTARRIQFSIDYEV
jgi:hypothetical protein